MCRGVKWRRRSVKIISKLHPLQNVPSCAHDRLFNRKDNFNSAVRFPLTETWGVVVGNHVTYLDLEVGSLNSFFGLLPHSSRIIPYKNIPSKKLKEQTFSYIWGPNMNDSAGCNVSVFMNGKLEKIWRTFPWTISRYVTRCARERHEITESRWPDSEFIPNEFQLRLNVGTWMKWITLSPTVEFLSRTVLDTYRPICHLLWRIFVSQTYSIKFKKSETTVTNIYRDVINL